MSGQLAVEVWGEFACFTQPAFKVERVSYPVMTPAAARGILESIFWRPEFSWRVDEIWVLKPIKYISFMRNELSTRQSHQAARQWGRQGWRFFAEDDRSQRHTLALRDVRYVILAQIAIRPHATDPVAKYRDQFRRRVERGRSFQQPYLGCREFVASFRKPDPATNPIDISMNVGRIFFDQRFLTDPKGKLQFRTHGTEGSKIARGTATPVYFEAQVRNGVLRVPQKLYEGGE